MIIGCSCYPDTEDAYCVCANGRPRVVTPQQLADGYQVCTGGVGGRITTHEYETVEQLDDGNWLVVDPADQ